MNTPSILGYQRGIHHKITTPKRHQHSRQQFPQIMPYYVSICVPCRNGTAWCSFDMLVRLIASTWIWFWHSILMDLSPTSASRSKWSNNIQQKQSDASTWPTCGWPLPSCQCRKACSQRRSARGPHRCPLDHDFQKKVYDFKFGTYRIIPYFTGVYSYMHFLAKPNSKHLQEYLLTLIGSWHVILLVKLLRQAPTMAGRTQIVFPRGTSTNSHMPGWIKVGFQKVPFLHTLC